MRVKYNTQSQKPVHGYMACTWLTLRTNGLPSLQSANPELALISADPAPKQLDRHSESATYAHRYSSWASASLTFDLFGADVTAMPR